MLARLGKIVASHGPEFDGQALQEDGEEVGYEDDEKKAVAERCSTGDVCGIVARVDVCD